MAVKLGIPIGDLAPHEVVTVTEEADRLGFDSVWLPEHLVLPHDMQGSPFAGDPHPPIPADMPFLDPFGQLAYLAARTERIRLATHVLNLGLRHPFVTARAVATLDVISSGRVELGVGASWLEGEWQAVGLDFASRGRRVDECLGVCQALWSQDITEHHGEFFDFGPVMFVPQPVQKPWPPIHVGGDGPAALRRAALNDGWVPMNHRLDELGPSLARIAELREQAGREGMVEVTFWGPVRGPGDLDRYAEAGVDRVLVRPWRSGEDPRAGLRAAGRNSPGRLTETTPLGRRWSGPRCFGVVERTNAGRASGWAAEWVGVVDGPAPRRWVRWAARWVGAGWLRPGGGRALPAGPAAVGRCRQAGRRSPGQMGRAGVRRRRERSGPVRWRGRRRWRARRRGAS